jgi:hypothetical protein
MTVTYYSILFYKYRGNRKFCHNSSKGFTSDKDLFDKITEISKSERDSILYLRWAASDEEDGKGQAMDIKEVKKACGGDLAEETSPGCWSTPGCEWY